MPNFGITFRSTGQLQPQSPSVEVVPDNNVSFAAKILKKTMGYRLRWHHISTCCRVVCTYYAYVTIRRMLGGTCLNPTILKTRSQGNTFQQKANKKQQNVILNICWCTLVASYERSNQNLTSRWVLAWGVAVNYPFVRVSKDVPSFRHPFFTSGTPSSWVFICHTLVGYNFFIWSHSFCPGSFWVIFVKFSYLATLWVIFVKIW